jgi:hypothetical protein
MEWIVVFNYGSWWSNEYRQNGMNHKLLIETIVIRFHLSMGQQRMRPSIWLPIVVTWPNVIWIVCQYYRVIDVGVVIWPKHIESLSMKSLCLKVKNL